MMTNAFNLPALRKLDDKMFWIALSVRLSDLKAIDDGSAVIKAAILGLHELAEERGLSLSLDVDVPSFLDHVVPIGKRMADCTREDLETCADWSKTLAEVLAGRAA